MTPDQKLIEFYFYQFTEYDFSNIPELASLQKELYQPKYDTFSQRPWKKTQPDAIAVLMGQAFARTFRHFFGGKRELMKHRYLQNTSRPDTCKRLKISERTYHRHVAEIVKFAEKYANHMRLAQEEFHNQVKFYSVDNSKNTYHNAYFSDYTQI